MKNQKLFSDNQGWEAASVNNVHPLAAGSVSPQLAAAFAAADEHSLILSTINQILYSSNKSTTKKQKKEKSRLSLYIRAKYNFQEKLKASSHKHYILSWRLFQQSSFCYFFLQYHNALGLAFTLLKEHEYIIIHTKEQVIVYELPAFPATKAIFIRKLNFILAPIWLPAEEKKPYA